MVSLLPSIIVLGLAALAAYSLTIRRISPATYSTARRSAAKALAIATAIQAVHFLEEAMNDFHLRLGAQFDLPAMPYGFFVAFNLAWIGIWIASIPGLQATRSWAFFAAWFLAIAGMLNGVLHPLLALSAGGYFPGLASSVFVAVASFVLWRRLYAATRTTDAEA